MANSPDIVVTIDRDTNPEGTPILWVDVNGERVSCISKLGRRWMVMMLPIFCHPDKQREWADSEWQAVGNSVAIYEEFKAREVAA